MGKYSSVIGSLRPAPIDDPLELKYQEKIEAAKSEILVDTSTGEIIKLTPDQLAAGYATLRLLHAKIDAERYALQVQITAFEQLIVASWDDDEEGWGTYGAGPNTVRLKDGSAVDVDAQPEGKVEDKEKFRLWCVAPADICMTCGGDEDAIGHRATDEHHELDNWTPHPFKPGGGLERKLQLHYMSMNAIAKERTLAGAPPPDGVAVYRRVSVKFRKG